MNNHRIAQIGAGILLLGISVSVSLSLAWFHPTTKIGDQGDTNTMPIDGSSSSGYFAYGDGSAEHPFGIKIPRHLYNLAWLQYIGHFKNKQLYFELADNVDMDGWTLPPIGTEENPFISQFNGKGYVVSNLNVSNNLSDYNAHPSIVTSSNFVQPHILGIFGVVGNYNNLPAASYDSSINTLTDTGIYNATIKTAVNDSLMGIAAGYVDADLKNVVVDSSTLNVASTSSTAYKTDLTTNVSDYSLVGYTTKKKTIKKTSKNIYGINIANTNEFNATEEGNANGWGGSIDMKSVLQRLLKIRNSGTKSYFNFRKTVEHHDTSTPEVEYENDYPSRSTKTTVVNNNDQYGHFVFLHRNDTYEEKYALMGGGHWQDDNYYSLVNHRSFQITNGTQYLRVVSTTINKTTTQSEGSYWAIDSDGKIYTKSDANFYYLRNNNGTLQATTNAANGSIWTLDDSGSNRVISSYSGTTRYALTYNNDNFVLSTGTATGETINPYSIYGDRDARYMTVDGTNVSYSSTQTRIWNFSSLTGETTISTVINGTTYYLGAQNYTNSRNVVLKTTETNWTWNISGTTRKLSLTGVTNNRYYRLLGFSNSSGYYWYLSNNSGYSYGELTISGTEEYVFDSNLLKTTFSDDHPIVGPDEEFDSELSTSSMNYEDDDVTYFPLTTVDDSTGDYRPADSNTAYVIGGSSINESTNGNAYSTTNTNGYGWRKSNVRFSSYFSMSLIDDDYNADSGTFTHIYTVNEGGNGKTDIVNRESEYERLKDTKKTLGDLMKGQSNTYGLHFMDSSISMNNITKVDYAKINGSVYTDYEMPVNSIDFNLKEFGYVNFVAGSYYNNDSTDRNNSFFSLYQVERNPSNHATAPNKITRILEILNVYKHSSGTKTYSYVYQLTDGINTFYTKPYKIINSEGGKEWLYDTSSSYSPNQYVNTLPSNYVKAFDVSRIKKNNMNSNTFDYHVYYFEIPMNDGEFCLGSVSGGVGCYLMYLDIGANAAKTYRTTFYEHFSLIENTYSYPLGVALVELPATFVSGTATVTALIPEGKTEIDYADSACMRIKPSALGTFKIDRGASGDVTLNRSNTTLAPPIYAGSTITKIHEGSSTENIELTAIESHSYDIKRMQYYDYMINTDTLVITTFTDTKDGNSSYVRTISQSIYSGSVVDSEKLTNTYTYDAKTDQRDSMKVYRDTKGSSNGIRYTSEEIANQETLPIATNNLSNTAILTLQIVQDGDGTFNDETILTVVVDESMTPDMYYTFGSYASTLTTASGDTLIVTVSVCESNVTIIVTNYSTGATSTITLANTEVVNGTNVTESGQVITITQP